MNEGTEIVNEIGNEGDLEGSEYSQGGDTQDGDAPKHGEPGAGRPREVKQSKTVSKPKTPPVNSLKSNPSPATSQKTEELHEVSINGKTRKLTTQQLKNYASKVLGADEKFSSSARDRKMVEEIVDLVDVDPFEAMEKLLKIKNKSLDKSKILDKFEEHYYKERIEPDLLSEEELALREYKEKNERLERQLKEREAQEAEQRRIHQEIAATKSYSKKIIEAMEHSKLPKVPYFAQQIAFYMRQNMLNKYDAPMEMICEQVKDEFSEVCKKIGTESTAEQLIELFGEDIIKKIRSYDLQKFRQRRTSRPQETPSFSSNPQNRSKNVDYDEMLKKLRGQS